MGSFEDQFLRNLEDLSRETGIPRLNEEWFGQLVIFLDKITNSQTGKIENKGLWDQMYCRLRKLANLQKMETAFPEKDDFLTYARLYDKVIGEPCLEGFMKRYLHFFQSFTGKNWRESQVLSIGCGTGLVEAWLCKEFGLENSQLTGIDKSPSMVNVAQSRIPAEVYDVLSITNLKKNWDVVFSGLNVLQYVGADQWIKAIRKTSLVVEGGGYFIGDFITRDHISWYPNVLYSRDRNVISLRNPQIKSINKCCFQESEIINVEFRDQKCGVYYEGRHLRFLPTIDEVREAFEMFFRSVHIFDSIELNRIEKSQTTCLSTRYLVIAQKSETV